jgi:hypothetical protein
MPDAPNPLNATYYANLAALQFQKEQALAQDKAGRAKAEAGFKYGMSQYEKAEPLRLTGNRNTANSQGLLESGQLAKRQGETQTEYTTKEARLAETRKAAIERYNEGDKRAEDAYSVGQNKALAESTEQARKETEANPPVPVQTAPPSGPPQPPQVVGIKAQPNSSAVRKAAAQKAVGLRRGWGVG